MRLDDLIGKQVCVDSGRTGSVTFFYRGILENADGYRVASKNGSISFRLEDIKSIERAYGWYVINLKGRIDASQIFSRGAQLPASKSSEGGTTPSTDT